MKKFIGIIALLLWSGAAMGQAVRRQATTRSSAAPAAKYAVYRGSATIIQVEESDKYLYLLEDLKFDTSNNAVIRIDKETGTGQIYIPGIAGVYEDVRDRIYEIAVTNDDQLYFVCGDFYKDNLSVYLYDGKSVETSKLIVRKSSTVSISPNSKYLFVAPYREGRFVAEIYDLETKELVSRVGRGKVHSGEVVIDNFANLWWKEFDKFIPLGSNEWKYLNTDFSGERSGYLAENDTVYFSNGRRVYAVPCSDPLAFEEFAKVPRTQNWSFVQAVVNKKGFLVGFNNSHRFVEFTPGKYDTPKVLDFYGYQTGLTDNSKYHMKLDFTYGEMSLDKNGNFLINNGRLLIYNPDGIKGYASRRGKFTEILDDIKNK